MKSFHVQMCPECDAPKLKTWTELTDEQKFLVERLPRNSEFTKEQRKKHRFCERCWFEHSEGRIEDA